VRTSANKSTGLWRTILLASALSLTVSLGTQAATDVKEKEPKVSYHLALAPYTGLAYSSKGEVWEWGHWFVRKNDIVKYRNKTPQLLQRPNEFVSISASDNYYIALKKDGSVWSFGMDVKYLNETGDLHSTLSVPQEVKGLSRIVKISAGQTVHAGLDKDGFVWAWRTNPDGETPPTKVPNIKDAVDISAANDDLIILTKDGSIWNRKELSGASLTKKAVKMEGIDNVAFLSQGNNSSDVFAVKHDGTVWGWGANHYGVVRPPTGIVSQPIKIEGLKDVISIRTVSEHALALKKDGTVWTWGKSSDYLAFGDKSKRDYDLVPRQVEGLKHITNIAAQYTYNMAVDEEGTLWSWGTNLAGQLADGTLTSSAAPVKVAVLPKLK
jgi:alpha-tubulin suppressor-like RCC1 family protein